MGIFALHLRWQVIQTVSNLFKIGKWRSQPERVVGFLALGLGQGVHAGGWRESIRPTELKRTEQSKNRLFL